MGVSPRRGPFDSAFATTGSTRCDCRRQNAACHTGGKQTAGFNPVPGEFNPVPGEFNPVPGDFNPVPAEFHPLPGEFHPLPGEFHPAPGEFHPAPGEFNPVPGEFNPVPGEFNPVPGVFNPVPGEFHPLPGEFNPAPGEFNHVPERTNEQTNTIIKAGSDNQGRETRRDSPNLQVFNSRNARQAAPVRQSDAGARVNRVVNSPRASAVRAVTTTRAGRDTGGAGRGGRGGRFTHLPEFRRLSSGFRFWPLILFLLLLLLHMLLVVLILERHPRLRGTFLAVPLVVFSPSPFLGSDGHLRSDGHDGHLRGGPRLGGLVPLREALHVHGGRCRDPGGVRRRRLVAVVALVLRHRIPVGEFAMWVSEFTVRSVS
eukprot:1196029-Prorocentrum_minimum.AAC.1